MDYRNITSVANILLTGATGVLGSRLLLEILQKTNAFVYCPVRDKDYEHGLRRIEKLLRCYDPSKELADQISRIVPLAQSDLTKNNMGLDENSYEELYQTIDLVLHSAANVSLVAPYDKLYPVNVKGTENIIQFCLNGDIPLLHVSSFSVLGDKLYEDKFIFKEEQLDISQGFYELHYERSKFEAEVKIHNATDEGLNWAIVRPGNIWGDSRTGCYPLFETKTKGIYYEIIRTLVDTGYTFYSNEDTDISPVDYVARASLYIALNIHKTNHRTYHLTNPVEITYEQIVEGLRGYGYTVRLVEDNEYFSALCENRMKKNGRVYSSIFTNLLTFLAVSDDRERQETAKYDTSNTMELLKNTGIVCPPPNQKLIDTYLAFCIKQKLIPPPENQYPLATIQKEADKLMPTWELEDLDKRKEIGSFIIS